MCGALRGEESVSRILNRGEGCRRRSSSSAYLPLVRSELNMFARSSRCVCQASLSQLSLLVLDLGKSRTSSLLYRRCKCTCDIRVQIMNFVTDVDSPPTTRSCSPFSPLTTATPPCSPLPGPAAQRAPTTSGAPPALSSSDPTPALLRQNSNGSLELRSEETIYTLRIETNDVGRECIVAGESGAGRGRGCVCGELGQGAVCVVSEEFHLPERASGFSPPAREGHIVD